MASVSNLSRPLIPSSIEDRMLKTANLSDLSSVVSARTNLGVFSQAEIGDVNTDFSAIYNNSKA